jgi:hypothetical protein
MMQRSLLFIRNQFIATTIVSNLSNQVVFNQLFELLEFFLFGQSDHIETDVSLMLQIVSELKR